jgi:steroid 5-alpha reductase family enzyme
MLDALYFALGLNLTGFIVAFNFGTDKMTDISYALTFAGIGVFGILHDWSSPAKWVVSLLVLVWAARLGGYLLYRIHTIGRDTRFDTMRHVWWRFGGFWLLQALAAWIVMLPATLLSQVPQVADIQLLVIIGAILALGGIVFEGISDHQKFTFMRNPLNRGKWMDSGLWAYSRHPNYFGEILTWVGVFVCCSPWLHGNAFFVGLISPVFIALLLIFVSGIPLLEKSADKKYGTNPQYQAYKRSTSILIPLPR